MGIHLNTYELSWACPFLEVVNLTLYYSIDVFIPPHH
jgi:hypothetical protein